LIIDIFFKTFLHFSDNFSELLSEDVAEEGTCHVQSLLTVVISIIFSCSTKSCLNKPVGHVSGEEGFLEKVSILNTDMRKKVLSQYIDCKLDSLVFAPFSLFSHGMVSDSTTHLSNVI